MAEFSIKEAAFAGYGLIKRKPGLFLALALFGLVVNLVGYWAIMAWAGADLAQMMDLRNSGDMAGMRDPGVAMRMAAASGKLSLIAVVISALCYVVSAGAVARAVIRPVTSRPPYIGFGADEMRLLMVGIVVGGILFVVTIVISTVFSILGVVVASAQGQMAQMAETGQMPTSMKLMTYGGAGLAYVVAFLLSVRFSLAPAQSEHEEGVRIFGSWTITKGRYWRVTCAYLLALLTLVPFYALASALNMGMAMAAGATSGEAIQRVMQPDWSQASLFAPDVFVFVVLNSLVLAIAWIVCLASSFTVYARVVGVASGLHDGPDDDDDDDDDDD